MNKVMLVGRISRDIDVRYAQNSDLAIAAFSVAVDRRIKKENEQNVDFINVKAFGKTAEFVNKYFSKGRRIGISGRLNTGSYTNQQGQKVYYMEVVADEVEFVDNAPQNAEKKEATSENFENIPDNIDEELPFN